jgi:hypothetical protein
MGSLSNGDIIEVWEAGKHQHLLDRALTILLAGYPEMTRERSASLTIGQRDGCLLDVREKTFGSHIRGFVVCPECSGELELTLSTQDIRMPVENLLDGREKHFELTTEGVKVNFRLPTSRDLAVVAGSEDMESAQKMILQRCVLESSADGKPIVAENLSAEVVERLAEYMSECDPQAEVLLNLRCPTCQHKWQKLFDIVTFLWEEISMRARRLLHEVHWLASAYGWREEDILSMSAARRQYYLQMVT